MTTTWTPATLYHPDDLPDYEAAVLADAEALADLPEWDRYVAERMAGWDTQDLEWFYRKHVGSAPKGMSRVQVLRACAAVNPYSRKRSVEGTALRIAVVVMNRWRAAGFQLGRDARGLVSPMRPGTPCAPAYAFLTSPSGKALFRCSACMDDPTPSPRSQGSACKGLLSWTAGEGVATALVAGVRYVPEVFDSAYVPVPAQGSLKACRRCWAVGEWAQRYRAGGPLVCPACYPLDPAPWSPPKARR